MSVIKCKETKFLLLLKIIIYKKNFSYEMHCSVSLNVGGSSFESDLTWVIIIRIIKAIKIDKSQQSGYNVTLIKNISQSERVKSKG